jgi:hypothetical protein
MIIKLSIEFSIQNIDIHFPVARDRSVLLGEREDRPDMRSH